MDVKVPECIGEPTLAIIDKKKEDEQNKITMQLLDNLEKRLDQQYKTFIDKISSQSFINQSYLIDKLQQSFMDNFDRMLSMNKSLIGSINSRRLKEVKEDFDKKLKSISRKNNNSESVKIFAEKLSDLGEAIKDITLKPVVVPNNNRALFNSFNKILKQMEGLIRQSTPRLIPSPS